ncbi:MAG: hypothetical protein AAF530_21670 [Pseudomonadota bacterium]
MKTQVRDRRALLLASILGFLAVVTVPTFAPAQSLPSFAVEAGDVQLLNLDGSKLYVQLTPRAAQNFARFTADHIGDRVYIISGDYPLAEARIQATNESGRLVFLIPDSQKLEAVVRRLTQ